MDSVEDILHDRPTRDTHALPPDHICEAYWKYNRIKSSELELDLDVVDFRRGLTDEQNEKLRPTKTISAKTIADACEAFEKFGKQSNEANSGNESQIAPELCTVYEHADFPGLRIYNSLLPPVTQLLLLSRIMHRDLANPNHKTNISADYDVPYPSPEVVHSNGQDQTSLSPDASFFTRPQSSIKEFLQPKDSTSSHKPLYMSQYLQKKLRWLTLGDQYDWPTRSYSGEDDTKFPADIAQLTTGLFPDLKAQSGVVLLYSPKDYMPVHRDVSEQCEQGLASFSLGCDGLFVIARDTLNGDQLEDDRKTVVIRVRSGDVIQMSGESRWAWHAMPKVVSGTCPDFMQSWPAGSETSIGLGNKSRVFERWKGYMAGKRLNISCRQVWD